MPFTQPSPSPTERPAGAFPPPCPPFRAPSRRPQAAPARLQERVSHLEERLARAEGLAALGQRAAQVAHDLRTPLNGIQGFAELLARDLAPDDPRHELARKIILGTRRLNRTIGNMLGLCRSRLPTTRAISARVVLEEALELVEAERRQLRRPALEVERHFAPAADLVEGDPDLLRQAFLNLLLNAAQAIGGHGTLRLSIAPAAGVEDASTITIEDSGPGIPEHLREEICVPFFTTKSSGIGLGLASVRGVVALHGGRFELRGGPGRGTAAIITLPRHISEDCPPSPEGLARKAAGHRA